MLANHPNVLGGGGVATNIIGGTGLFADGTVAAPSISFLADQDTGLYRIGANNIGVSANGAKVLDITTTGLKVSGGGNNTIAFEATSTPSSFPRSIQFETDDSGGTFITANSFGSARNVAPSYNQTLTIGTNGHVITNDIIFALGLDGTYTEKLRLAATVATFAGAVVAPSLTAPAATNLALAAGSGNQNITLTPSGTGVTNLVGNNVSPLLLTKGSGAGGIVFSFNGTQYLSTITTSESGALANNYMDFGVSTGANTTTQFVMRLKGDAKVLIGTTVDSSALLQVGTDTSTSAGGMVFGTDTSLYRLGSGSLSLTGKLHTTSYIRPVGGIADSSDQYILINVQNGNRLDLGSSVSGSVQVNQVLKTVASVAGSAGLNVPHGAAPTTPTDGDMWTTNVGLYVRINGATVGPLT